MASIIPGYNYDIFISYRQKDNKGDRWVSEFVDALKDELESTFKEEISVYFDVNPHDGLLETHDVDESLKEKLKCLVFIPIISRTYCDPKSFAWEHEFKVFVEQTSKDQFGLKVRLPNGNVSSRVLPISIYDLDDEDIKLCESVLGGVLRGIDFIHKASGVNRPLTPNDDLIIEAGKVFYKDQINKVANAIKEIIGGLKTEPVASVQEKTQQKEPSEQVSVEEKRVEQAKPMVFSKRKLLSGIAIIAILIVAAIILYPKIFKQDRLEYLRSQGKISVAVMPFQNMSENTALNSWQDMIQFMLISFLSEDLEVRQAESVEYLVRAKGITNYASFTPSLARSISKKLDASVFIQGGILQVGTSIRIDAQLIDTKKGTIIKSFPLDIESKETINPKSIDSLAALIKDFLILSELTQKRIPDQQLSLVSTSDHEAYRNYFDGKKSFAQRDWNNAAKYLSEAIRIDSNFTFATIVLSWTYLNSGRSVESKRLLQNALRKKDQMSPLIKIKLEDAYAGITEGPQGRIKYLKQFRNYDDQDPHNYSDLGTVYNTLEQYDEAIPEFTKALNIYKKWGTKPFWIFQYTRLGEAYHETGQFRKEKELYRKAQKDFPDDPNLLQRQAILALSQGKTKAANEYIEKYKSILRDNSASDAAIASNLAGIYSEAGILDTTEVYYRKALSLRRGAGRLNTLAYFLIDNDRDIEAGLEFVDQALELNPNNYNFLDCKAWGLYKEGKMEEATKFIIRSDSLKPIYNHRILLHKQEIEKALASQN